MVLRSCFADVEKRPLKAHAQRRRNEKLAASATAKEHGRKKVRRRNTSYGTRPLGCKLWRLAKSECRRSCFVQ